jgi:hypothetical protein
MEIYQVLCLLKKYSRDCSEEKALQGRAGVLIQARASAMGLSVAAKL